VNWLTRLRKESLRKLSGVYESLVPQVREPGPLLESTQQQPSTIRNRTSEAAWLKIYHESRKHLPEDYHDKVWETYIADRIEELRGTHGDEFILWITDEGVADDDTWSREQRSPQREIRVSR